MSSQAGGVATRPTAQTEAKRALLVSRGEGTPLISRGVADANETCLGSLLRVTLPGTGHALMKSPYITAHLF